MADKKKANGIGRWGGLLLVAGLIGGLVVGFNMLTIAIMALGLVLIMTSLVSLRFAK